MRKHKRITLDIGGDKHEMTVLEMTVKDVLTIYEDLRDESGDIALGEAFGNVDGILPMFVEGLDLELIKTMAPSEIEELWNQWKGVNASFFGMAQSLGLLTLLENVKMEVINNFYGAFFTSFIKAMPEPSITAGNASS